MRKSLYRRMLIGLLWIGFSLACGLPFLQPAPTETETPTPLLPASPTNTDAPLPTAVRVNTLIPAQAESAPLETATPKFAPFCQQSSANVFTPTPFSCHLPIAEQSSAYCSNKVPYNLIRINPGSTYEVIDDVVTCKEAGEQDAQQVLSCTGRMAIPFEIIVCDPSCAVPTFQAGNTDCPQDYYFNESLRCCEQFPQPVDQNCVTLKLETRSCVIDCRAYTDQTTCDTNAFACEWDSEKKLCNRRK